MPIVKRAKTLIGPLDRANDFSTTLFALVDNMRALSIK
jgi:hypothetical protein